MTRNLLIAACVLGVASRAVGASVSLDDYREGVTLAAPDGVPLVETTVPEIVYRGVTRADLGDMRVFNAEGLPVPHALCAARGVDKPTIWEQALPVFQLRGAPRGNGADSSVEVQTPDGAEVNVRWPGSAEPRVDAGTYIIDARASDDPIRAIQFDWQSSDGASQAQVRIEASNDLDQWHVLVPSTTLLQATSGDQQLRRERVELPMQTFDYLRVQRADGGAPLTISGVRVERMAVAVEIEPVWFTARALAVDDPEVLFFDTERRAPVTYARLRLPQDNSSVRATLHSRDDGKANWVERWSGEAYRIVTDTQRRESPPAHFRPTSDRYWRLEIAKDPQLYRGTLLEFGYQPARVRFLAQGSGPYTLAFGSRRAEPFAGGDCSSLLADVSPGEREQLVGEGVMQGTRVLGGDRALRPMPKQTPVRLVVLWSVLIVGVAALVGMALTLLKRVRKGEQEESG